MAGPDDPLSENTDHTFSAWWQDWLVAISHLTMFRPEIEPPADARGQERARRAYPLVALLLGLLVVVIFGLGRSLGLFDLGAAILALAALALLTGAKGEIGLAAYVEAVARTRDLAVRRDLLRAAPVGAAPVGYAGMLAMMVAFMLRIVLVATVLHGAAAVLIAAIVGSRAALALAPAFRPGDAPALDADEALFGNEGLWLAAALGAAFLLLFLGPWSGLVAIVVGFLALLAAIGIVRRQCEGFAAPAYAFIQQFVEIALLIAAVASS